MIPIRSTNVSTILIGLWVAQLQFAIPTSLLILLTLLLLLAPTYFEYRDVGSKNPSASRSMDQPAYMAFFRDLYWLFCADGPRSRTPAIRHQLYLRHPRK